ncbi:hypothetical protein EV652_122101 [Kribbella steppae]|uniref:Ribbon-helix-helix CopG family protein n=1 Tax=Kribbella steppae TaxID=2512223 RepID=A0A4R2GX42_9ACTN|nr:hypothetical protein [Kribbella steppae]TCO15443.1 hypothetical protein EV652_122101 [Kribbella steppae]
MAVKKKTLSFDEDLWAAVERRAREAETTPSAYVNELVARSERLYRGLQAVSDWESEHGALTADQLDWADRALADAQREAADDEPADSGGSSNA